MESQPTSGEVAAAVAAELDAAHERARQAYARRDAAAYIDTFHADLRYTQRDGQTIDREQLARDVRVQLGRVHAAASEFHREAMDSDSAERATEILLQHARFEVRAFGIVHREWIIRRRGRYEWLRTPAGWKIRRVEVLSEEISPARTWFAFG